MRNILKIMFLGVGMTMATAVCAQNNNGKSDDAARIALAPVINDSNLPLSAKQMLENKIRKICTLNGLAGEGSNPLFSIKASVDVVSRDYTATAPPMHTLVLNVNLYIVDNKNGNVYSQTSVEVKGAGQNETKAYSQAIKNINPKQGQFKAFVEQGKNKILEFYNSQCDFVISQAQALKSQGRDDDAAAVLHSVPKVCKECYDQCMELAGQMSSGNYVAPQQSNESASENE